MKGEKKKGERGKKKESEGEFCSLIHGYENTLVQHKVP